MHYTGWLPNGKKFDSSRDRGEPFAFTLGAGQVITGWDEGVKGMKVGGRRKLVLAARSWPTATAGAPPDIPPGATLVFDVEVLGRPVTGRRVLPISARCPCRRSAGAQWADGSIVGTGSGTARRDGCARRRMISTVATPPARPSPGRRGHDLPVARQQELLQRDTLSVVALAAARTRTKNSPRELVNAISPPRSTAAPSTGFPCSSRTTPRTTYRPMLCPPSCCGCTPAERAHVQERAAGGRVVDRAIGSHVGAEVGRVAAELQAGGQVERAPERLERLERLVDDLVVRAELAERR